jgi:hypothetical protein
MEDYTESFASQRILDDARSWARSEAWNGFFPSTFREA